MSSLRIRSGTPADAAALAALINGLNSFDGPPARPMTEAVALRDLLGPAPRAWLRLAERDGQVVGFATATAIYEAKSHGDIMMLLDLYVAPEARRRGAARALMAALAAEARAVRRRCGGAWMRAMTRRRCSTAPSVLRAKAASAAKSWKARRWRAWRQKHVDPPLHRR